MHPIRHAIALLTLILTAFLFGPLACSSKEDKPAQPSKSRLEAGQRQQQEQRRRLEQRQQQVRAIEQQVIQLRQALDELRQTQETQIEQTLALARRLESDLAELKKSLGLPTETAKPAMPAVPFEELGKLMQAEPTAVGQQEEPKRTSLFVRFFKRLFIAGVFLLLILVVLFFLYRIFIARWNDEDEFDEFDEFGYGNDDERITTDEGTISISPEVRDSYRDRPPPPSPNDQPPDPK